MKKIVQFNLQTAVDQWSRQIKSIPFITESDSEEYKYGMLDMIDDFKSKGLDEEEAFCIASGRFKKILNYQDEIEYLNMPSLQLRRITQVLSGVVVLLLLFFLMQTSAKLIFLKFFVPKDYVFEIIKYIYYYIYAFHLFIVLVTLILYFNGKPIIRRIESLEIKPVHLFFAVLIIVFLTGINQWLFLNISTIYDPGIAARFRTISDFSSYSFPLIFSVCFILLYLKYYNFGFMELKRNSTNKGIAINEEISKTNIGTNPLTEHRLPELKKMGLNEDEVMFIEMKRNGLRSMADNDSDKNETLLRASWRSLLIVLSGVLLYFFIHFFLEATARILISVLQIFKYAPLFSIRWTWFYTIVFHLILIFFTTSLLIRDVNLINRLKQIKIKPVHSVWIFIATILCALVDRGFLLFSRHLIGHDLTIVYRMEKIFEVSEYSLPFLISFCFLILFNKYYRDNMKIG